jgi:hypothetical protein
LRISAPWRRVAVALTTIATAAGSVLAGSVLAASPAEARARVSPGSFTGYAFDQCVTQPQEVMDAWLTSSPYWAVGIYIAGDSRYCGDDKQVNLTPEWVETQLRYGWRLIPITVGPQASCQPRYKDKVRIKADPTNDYAAAREQARAEAQETVRRAHLLGIPERTTLWYDIEAFDIGKTRCRESALAFLSAWTTKLHELNHVSGVYSSAASGIKMLDEARRYSPGRYAMPDQLWVAEWMDASDYRQPPTPEAPSLHSVYYDSYGWAGRVMRQYRGGHDETYAGVKINIDTNYLHLGRGSVAPKEPHHCGVEVDFAHYRRQMLGREGDQVTALQCLLKQRGLYGGRLHGIFNARTERSVKRFEAANGLLETGRMSLNRWGVLLTQGPTPLAKIGSASHAVRRIQRALNALGDGGVEVTGVFDHSTTQAVRAYQKSRGLPQTGVAALDTWLDLTSGRVGKTRAS